MCGIFAWANVRTGIDPDKLKDLTNLLQHRGPDDMGFHISPDRQIGLGFRRLSIIDLSPAGHQPMSSRDGSIWIVFNGEMYNYAEIRVELESLGHVFRSRSDTEVIIHAYEEWGEAGINKFIGMFGLVIWDARREAIIAFRDRLGVKPLYYSVTSQHLLVSSELKSIIASPGFVKDIDMSALEGYLADGYVSAPRTIFCSVKCLLPGHKLLWSRSTGKFSLEKYWDPLEHFCNSGHVEDYSEEQWIDQLDAILQSAVKYRLISDVPLGVFLSGGIDSSLVAALVRQISTEEVKTFTVGFEHTRYNEAEYAGKIARHLGTAHTLLHATLEDARQLIHDLPKYFDEPFADSSQIPTYLVSKLTRQHVTVSLSGDGGDELFCGYETYQKMAKWQHLWMLPQFVRDFAGKLADILPNHRLKLAAQGLALPGPLDFAKYFNGFWRPQEISALLQDRTQLGDNSSGVAHFRDLPCKADVLESLMLIDLQKYLPNDILTKVDRASMAVSLEARTPLLDHRVVELALKMPFHLKRRKGTAKYALRQVLYRYVPRELVDRPKQGFGVPLSDWLRADLHGLLDKYLDPHLVRKQGLFNHDAISQQVGRFMKNEAGHSRIWALLMFQMWAERYLDLKA